MAVGWLEKEKDKRDERGKWVTRCSERRREREREGTVVWYSWSVEVVKSYAKGIDDVD